jgi:ankyrin repeat protein
MSFADLPPELVLHVAAALHDTQDMLALDPGGWSPLSYAIRRGNRAAVRRLLESGADVGIEHGGFTVLNMAVAQGDEGTRHGFKPDWSNRRCKHIPKMRSIPEHV